MIQLLIGISVVAIYFVILYAYENKDRSLTHRVFAYIFMAMILQALGSFVELCFYDFLKIPTIYYEYFIYIGKALLPTLLLVFALVYDNPRFDVKKISWLFIIPIFLIIMVWTNGLHHEFFVAYSGMGENVVYGFMHVLYVIITIAELVPAILILAKACAGKCGALSPQTILMLVSVAMPLIPWMLGALGIIKVPSYTMPICYLATALIMSLNIIKYNALNAVPIAFKSVVDIMSDAFIVISPDGTIIDMNRSFKCKFELPMNLKDNKNIYDVARFEGISDMKKLKNQILEAEDKGTLVVDEYHIIKEKYDKYFEVQVQPIKARNSKGFIATLIVFRDVTEQKDDIDVLIKKESLSVIGELAGGVAHDINTPISAIKSGLLMLRNTSKSKDEKALIESMTNSADKISNLVNSLKNQIRNLGSETDSEFNLTELVQDLHLMIHSELAKHNVKVDLNITDDIWISGNTSKLTQVITNIIYNSMEAYGNKGGIIDVNIYKNENNDNVIMIEDWAGGIPEDIQPYIFKKIISYNNMPTIGVGLYLAYSVIKGSFGGDIKFDTKIGRGTKFYITIPNS